MLIQARRAIVSSILIISNREGHYVGFIYKNIGR
jgi:hypothetical protein